MSALNEAITNGTENTFMPYNRYELWMKKLCEAILAKDPADPDVVEAFVNDWLDDHPEATTTVEDGAVTTAKVADGAITDAKLAASGVKSDVADLKSEIKLLEETQQTYLFNQTVAGSVMKQINVSIPSGNYTFKVSSVNSTDTQYNTSRITFFGNGTSWSTDITRTSGADKTITLAFDVTSIAFYGAHNYSDSAGVTFSYNDVQIIANTALATRLIQIETDVDNAEADISEMETELHLIVKPYTITETAGYYSDSGAINSATSNQEVYTNKLSVDKTNKVYWSFDTHGTTAKSCWIAYMKYDSDNNVVGSRVQIFNESATSASGSITIPDNVAYISFTYRTFGISNTFKSAEYINEDAITNLEKGISSVRPYTFPFAHDKFYGHLLLNYVDESNAYERIIPCQSVFDVEMTAKFGFKYIEANVHATATSGKYVVTHGISGKLGNDFETSNGENVPSVVIAETSFDDLRTNYRYKSIYPKYKVPITSLEEFLYACRTNNIYPVLQYVDDTELAIAQGIVGDNLILYGGSRSVFNGYIMEYKSLSTESAIVGRCAEVGAPYMYCMGNPTSFSDEQLKSIINKVHKLGCYIGNVGAYDGFAQTNRLLNLGFDFSASGGLVNDFDNGNIINICNSPTFTGVATTGTVANGTLTLLEDETITIESDDTSFLKKYLLDINYVGEMTISCPNKTGKDVDTTIVIESDGTQNVKLSNCLLARTLSITLTANAGGVTVRGLTFRMSKC